MTQMETPDFNFKKYPRPDLCHVMGCRQKRVRARLCWRHLKEQWRRRNPIRSAWQTIKDRAKRKKREFTLTFEEFSEWAAKHKYIDGKGRERHCLHCDRIDPSKGYSIDNIQILTCTENTTKGNYERERREPDCPF